MIIEPDQELVDELMVHLRDALFGRGLSFTQLPDSHSDRSDEVHLSDLDGCITRKFNEKVSIGTAGKIDDKGVLYMLTGTGFEMYLTGIVSHMGGQSRMYQGIPMTADFVKKSGDPAEIKTTRMYPDKGLGIPAKNGLPEFWLRRLKGYTLGHGLDHYSLAILYIGAATLVGLKFTFDDDELMDFDNEMLLPRAAALREALDKFKETGVRLPPEPFAYNDAWECLRCPFNFLCAATKQTGDYLPSTWEHQEKYMEITP